MGIKERIIPFCLLSLIVFPLCAQRRVSADVEVKSVKDGKVTTVTKSVWCSGNGRLVAFFHKPQEFYLVSNLVGEASIYSPSSNEVWSSVSEDQSSRDDLLMIFLTGRVDDLCLSSYGYRVTDRRSDGDVVVKTFSGESGRGASRVEIAYKDYLPVHVAYFDASGRVLSKKYLSRYSENEKGFVFPGRMVDIIYSAKKDSTIVRTLYSNISVDTDDPMFDYQIPSDAKASSLPR